MLSSIQTGSISGGYSPALIKRQRIQKQPPAEQPQKLSLSQRAELAKQQQAKELAALKGEKPIPKALQPLINDIQTMANDLGYMDVSPQAIVKAYQNQGSFLADVRA